jgi:hypothetical protein
MDKKSIIIYVFEVGKYEFKVKNCKFIETYLFANNIPN